MKESKIQIVESSGRFVNLENDNKKKFKKVVAVKATGTQIVVEKLTNEQASGSNLTIMGKSEQAIIVDMGPALESEKWGFKVGDRVLLQGNYVPVGAVADKDLAVVDPYTIKCVLLEE